MTVSVKRNYTETIEYITPDGVRYLLEDNDHFVLTEEGLGMPPIQYITQKTPFQHGETVIDFRLQPRVIQLLVRANACDRQSYWDLRSNLIGAIRPNRQTVGQTRPGHLRKTLPDGTKRDLDVFIEVGPMFVARDPKRWDEFSYQETLRFVAHDPVWYDPTVRCTTWTYTVSEELVFPMVFGGGGLILGSTILEGSENITYAGTWLAYPTIQIDGPLASPIIENETTGEFIKLNYTVSIGETVTINLSPGNKTVINGSGTNLIGTVTLDSDLTTFHLEPSPGATGGVNVVTVSGGLPDANTTAIRLSYYTRYIGI